MFECRCVFWILLLTKIIWLKFVALSWSRLVKINTFTHTQHIQYIEYNSIEKFSISDLYRYIGCCFYYCFSSVSFQLKHLPLKRRYLFRFISKKIALMMDLICRLKIRFVKEKILSLCVCDITCCFAYFFLLWL